MAREARYRRNRAEPEAAMARPLEGMGSSKARGRAARGWGGLWTARGLGRATYSRGESSRGRGQGGTWRATCPRVSDGATLVGAAKANERQREGDEGDHDERQRLTETRGIHG